MEVSKSARSGEKNNAKVIEAPQLFSPTLRDGNNFYGGYVTFRNTFSLRDARADEGFEARGLLLRSQSGIPCISVSQLSEMGDSWFGEMKLEPRRIGDSIGVANSILVKIDAFQLRLLLS